MTHFIVYVGDKVFGFYSAADERIAFGVACALGGHCTEVEGPMPTNEELRGEATGAAEVFELRPRVVSVSGFHRAV